MFCRVCNSRIRPGGTACSNCGSHSIVHQGTGTSTTTVLPPAVINEDPDDPIHADSDRTPRDEGGDEVELSEPAEVGGPVTSLREEPKQEPPVAQPGGAVAHAAFAGSVDSDGLRTLLGDRPDLLEAGLRVFTNDKGTPLGLGYTTAVGEIDLLARDAGDGFVVVMIAGDESAEQLVAGVLQRMGWVRKHLSAGEREVRGVVLLDGAREDIAYAAAAVSDKVSFKTYRVAVCFDDIQF